MMSAVPYILLVGAASFLYIALVDLTPYLHRRFGLADSLLQLGLILAGIATIWLLLCLSIKPHMSGKEGKINKINQFMQSISFWNACLIAIGLLIAALLVLVFSLAGQVLVQ